MRMLTFKLKPKKIFGLILLAVGLIVVVATFLCNHSAKPASASKDIICSTLEERTEYLSSFDIETDGNESSKEIVIPSRFNDVYTRYNEIQKEQGFDLTNYKGQTATLYTYNVTNYDNKDSVEANLIVYDDILIGADLCDTSADDGFLVALNDKDR